MYWFSFSCFFISFNLILSTFFQKIKINNYVLKVKGKENLTKIVDEFTAKNPDIKLKYMDCNHPFNINIDIDKNRIFKNGIKTFPVLEGLFPHFSHIDKRVDLSFVYNILL